ncbi:hypothetical protein H5991_08295 [Ligilactobacillus agilis]|uniref:hypothetical protein n=1 Tax=Ligilactobacillus agilis TaxID=1601 RepID=UPI0019572E09|nr:hypothetical protein [Ligilactobacillus agilis]MBM6773480.1 hypothetical protein [Ligilactobacillus agilis]
MKKFIQIFIAWNAFIWGFIEPIVSSFCGWANVSGIKGVYVVIGMFLGILGAFSQSFYKLFCGFFVKSFSWMLIYETKRKER